MLRNQEVNQFAVNEVIRLHSELEAARDRAEKWERVAKSGSRLILSIAALLSVVVMGVVAAGVIWLRAAAAAKGGY